MRKGKGSSKKRIYNMYKYESSYHYLFLFFLCFFFSFFIVIPLSLRSLVMHIFSCKKASAVLVSGDTNSLLLLSMHDLQPNKTNVSLTSFLVQFPFGFFSHHCNLTHIHLVLRPIYC